MNTESELPTKQQEYLERWGYTYNSTNSQWGTVPKPMGGRASQIRESGLLGLDYDAFKERVDAEIAQGRTTKSR